MKLSRWSDNDIADIGAMINSGTEIDFDFLNYLVYDDEEARGAGMSDRTYDNLLFAYNDMLDRKKRNDWQVR